MTKRGECAIKKGQIKAKIKKIAWFFANPRLLLCLGIGWIITNGWSYIMLGLGILWDIGWMQAVAGAYLAFLWFPFTPEKIVTVLIAILLLRLLFPKDEKTLEVLRGMFKRAKKKEMEAERAETKILPEEQAGENEC